MYRGRSSLRTTKLLAALCLGALALSPLLASGASAEAAGREALEQAVAGEMLGRPEARAFGYTAAERQEKTQTNVQRESKDGRWAFGTAIVEAPKRENHYPQGWLFVAEKTGAGWQVGLEGSREFEGLVEEAPVVGEKEKQALTGGGPEFRAGSGSQFWLPWRRGGRWKLTGGPHGWATGYDRPYSALDFAGGGGRVRSVAPGYAYTMCGAADGWVRVYHGRGFSTDYYHLRRNVKPNGRRISAGQILGLTGETTCGGGAAYGAHVHFALRRYDKPVAINGFTLGGWTFYEGSAYEGAVQHGASQRYPVTLIRHFR